MTRYAGRDERRYRRATRRAFAQVTFYREQCAAAGRMLAEPEPTPVAAIPQPPHTLCPFARPWSADREPSLWTPSLVPLARALRMAGCRATLPVLEVREALLDGTRLPRLRRPGRRPDYRVLLSATAVVTSPAHRAALNREALAVVQPAGAGWLVGGPAELAALPELGAGRGSELLRPVHRVPVAAAATDPAGGGPTLLYEPMLGYLGALVPECRRVHLDTARVYARDRDGAVTLSLTRSRRPTLLDIVPPGAERVTVGRCDRHRTPILTARPAAGTS